MAVALGNILSLVHLLCIYGVHAVSEDDYKIISDTLPEDSRFRPAIGNGHVATNVYTDTVYMNGLYNGLEDRSSRARIPAYITVDVNMTDDVILKRQYTLDMYNGLFIKDIQTSTENITIITFAHRSLHQLLVTQLRVMRYDGLDENCTINISDDYGKESSDFNWQHIKVETDQKKNRKSVYHFGQIKESEIPNENRPVLHIYHTVIPDRVTLQSGQEMITITYIASHSTDQIDSLLVFQKGLRQEDYLLTSHKQEWNKLWEDGTIDIHGNKDMSTTMAAAFYNTLCSLPTTDDPVTPFYGLGPGGLSRGGLLYPEKPGGPHNDYAGHIFWDMDTWVMPTFILFHPSMARRMIGARTRVLDQAKRNAEKEGYKGAKFPWEQASTGIEVTPRWAGNMSLYEIHVTADIAYGLRQYLYASDNISAIMDDRLLEMAIEVARFWQSRATETDGNTVEIFGVMGPDEYHFNVNNSVFTNYNAKLSLQLPSYIINTYKLPINETLARELRTFESTASRMLILFDEEHQYHPQYENFNLSGSIKQSDVVLLGYPLMMPMARQVRRNDLELYEKITDAQGPDTGTWSMHTVGWLELGDEKRANMNFRMMLRNINEPFKVFSEKPVTNESYGGCVNFVTGAGGLLQSVVFGYGGLRLHPDRLEMNPTLLPNTTFWRLKGIHYKGVVIDIVVRNGTFSVNAVKMPSQLNVTISGTKLQHTVIRLNGPVVLKRQVASLRVFPANGTENIGTPTTVSAACNTRLSLLYSVLAVLSTIVLHTSVKLFQ